MACEQLQNSSCYTNSTKRGCPMGQPLLFIAPRGVELLRSDRRATCADQPSTSRRESSRASQACSSGWGTACRRAFVCQTCIAPTARRSKPSTPDTRQRAFLTPTSPGSRSQSCDAQSSFRVQYDSPFSCYKSQISFFRGSNGFSRHRGRVVVVTCGGSCHHARGNPPSVRDR